MERLARLRSERNQTGTPSVRKRRLQFHSTSAEIQIGRVMLKGLTTLLDLSLQPIRCDSRSRAIAVSANDAAARLASQPSDILLHGRNAQSGEDRGDRRVELKVCGDGL